MNYYTSRLFHCMIKLPHVQGTGACPGGGGKGPPPRNWKAKNKGHQSKFQAISPIFCYFFSRKYYFLCYFSELGPSLKNWKAKKKFPSDSLPPPPPPHPQRIPGHATARSIVWLCQRWCLYPRKFGNLSDSDNYGGIAFSSIIGNKLDLCSIGQDQ